MKSQYEKQKILFFSLNYNKNEKFIRFFSAQYLQCEKNVVKYISNYNLRWDNCMRKHVLKILSIAFLIISLAALTGCDAIQKLSTGKSNANACFDEFCYALSSDDYESAYAKVHPHAFPKYNDMLDMLEKAEYDFKLDFSNGIILREYYDLGMLYYDSKYDGAVYSLAYTARVGKTEVEIYAIVVDNKAGYGIYEFSVIPITLPEFKI